MGKERVESTAQWRKKYKFMCMYKYTCVVPLLFHLVIVLCLCECSGAEEGSEEKINEEGTSTSNSLLGSDCLCLPLNMENMKERGYHCT